jgi:hypothetical protein
LAVRALPLAAESGCTDQARESHWDQANGRESVACNDTGGNEQQESWEHVDDGDDTDGPVSVGIARLRWSVHCVCTIG